MALDIFKEFNKNGVRTFQNIYSLVVAQGSVQTQVQVPIDTRARYSEINDDDGNQPEDGATDGATTGDNLKDSTDTVLEDREVKNIATLTAGETINGATLPVAVFQDISDNEFYACDGNDTSKLTFTGFAISNGTDGNDLVIQFTNVVGGFTGLSEGARYYVQDDKTIGISPGTYSILVGIAVSQTEIQILKEPATEVFASDNLRDSANTPDGVVPPTAYTKVKEILFNEVDGEIRVSFQMDTQGSSNSRGKIYINGIAVGTEQSEGTPGYQTYVEDFSVEQGDLIQLYILAQTFSCLFRNFQLKYDKLLTPLPGTINLD